MRLLPEKEADVSAQSGRALRVASECGQIAIIQLLLKNKTDARLVLHDADAGMPVDNHEAMKPLLLNEAMVILAKVYEDGLDKSP